VIDVESGRSIVHMPDQAAGDTRRLSRRAFTSRVAAGLGVGSSIGAIAALAACGRETPAPAALALQPAELEFQYHWSQNSPGEQGWSEIVKKFEAAHRGVKVQLVRHGGFDKVLAAASAGTPPHLIDLNPAQYAAVAPRGLLVKLDPYLKRGQGVRTSDLIPALQEQATLNGTISAMPSEAGTSLVFYNLDLIEEAGLKAPARSWRWQQEFLEIARRVTRDGPPEAARFGVEHVFNGWWGNQWYAPVWAFGGDLLSKDYKRCTLNEAKSVEGLQFVADLTHKWRVTANAAARQTSPQGRPFFETGRLALHPAGHFYYAQIKARNLFRWGVMSMPHGPAGSKGALNGWWTGIGQEAKHHDQAWAFISFYLQPEHYSEFLRFVSWMPPIKAVERPPLVEDAQHWTALTGAAQTARSVPMLPQFDDVLKVMNDGLRPVFDTGERTATAAVQEICTQASAFLR
jgi:multiple sugar transport system substrate-binding protein